MESGNGKYIRLIIVVLIIGTIISGLYIAFRPWPDIRVKSIQAPDNIALNETEDVQITVVNKGDAFGSKRIFLQVDNEEFRSHLFAISEDVEDIVNKLNKEKTSERLENLLENKGFQLSEKVKVFVNEQGDNWVLHDKEKGYNLIVVDDENELNVLLDSRIISLEEGEEKTIDVNLKLENRGIFTISSGECSRQIEVI